MEHQTFIMTRSRLILAILLTCSTSCLVKCAPAQLVDPPGEAPGPKHDIQELANSKNLQLTNTTVIMSTTTSSGYSTNIPSNYGNQDVREADSVVSKDKVNPAAGTAVERTGARPNLMALSDDVITDALFTNIDTLQDHLEVCEEGLRQQLRLHSHGRLLQEVAAGEEDFKTTKEGVSNKENKNDNKFEDNEDDDDDDDDDDDAEDDIDADNAVEKDIDSEINDSMMMDNKDAAKSPNVKVPKTKSKNVRRRRSLAGASNAQQAPSKADNLAQKVVNRLSARLEYLKASLIQCHLLYRQFGLL